MKKRNKVIKIRVTDSEYEDLLARSHKRQLATWMRENCLEAKIPKANKVPMVDARLLRQVVGIGNNLNQIARAIHSQEWKPVDRVQVISALSSLQREISILRSENTGS